jgi:four helix bundle protein
MGIRSYKELIVWQKAVDLVKEIYKATQFFPKTEIFTLVSQMRRAAISIPSNIAEGFNRRNTKEYRQFLHVSYGSGSELETQMILAKDLYPKIDYSKCDVLLEEVQKMLNVLISRL